MLALALSVFSGCGGGSQATPTGTVTGSVTLNGAPLIEGHVNFVNSELGVGAGGDLAADGTYELEGPIPEGPYGVFITFNIAPSELGTPKEAVMKSVPKKYLGQKTSGLTADVNVGPNSHDFDLKK